MGITFKDLFTENLTTRGEISFAFPKFVDLCLLSLKYPLLSYILMAIYQSPVDRRLG